MIYLLLSILFTTTLMLIFKLFERFNINNFQAIVFNYITASCLCFFLVDTPISISQVIEEPWFKSAFIIGVLFICCFNLIAFSAQKIGIANFSSYQNITLHSYYFWFYILWRSNYCFKNCWNLFSLIFYLFYF